MSVTARKQPTSTTTISTVAVQSGKARIVLAVLQSAEWIQVRVDDMIPRMTDIGTNLEEAKALQKQHEDVIQQLVSKQDQIGSLLSQADNQVSTQQFYGDVYQAMAKSLGEAWKDLGRQMETRQQLLGQAVDFYKAAQQYNDKLTDGIKECRSMAMPDAPQQMDRQLQRHKQIKKDMLEGSMEIMSKGRDLLDRLRDLDNRSTADSRRATNASCFGVERAMEDIQDKRRMLDDLWQDRSRRLDQMSALRDIDQEVNKISDWFRTHGEMYLQRRDIGNNAEECDDLLRQHQSFEVAAGDVQKNVQNLLATSEQVRHSDPESTERLRSQTRAIDTLCDDFMQRLADRRGTLQQANDFYRNANLAKTYLSRLRVQLSQDRLPKDDWSRSHRLDKLNNAISEISTPVLNEGRALVDQVGLSTPGAPGVQAQMEEIQAMAADLQAQAQPELREQAALQVAFDEKYKVLIKWLVNVGDAFLTANNDMGDQLQTTMDFLDGHEKLLGDIREKSTQVDITLEIANKLGSNNKLSPEQTNKLKQHWTRVTITVENRIRVAHILIKFHKLSKQLSNAMDNMTTLLKSEETKDMRKMKKTTMQHCHEKWNQMVEINIQLENAGHSFINEVSRLVNDKELITKTSRQYVEKTIKSFAQRKIYLDDLYDSLNQRYLAEETFKSQWQQFVRDARQTVEFVINMEGNVFPRLTTEAGASIADAGAKKSRLQTFQETVTKVTTEVQMRLKTAEMLGAKGDTGGEKEQIVEKLTSVHKRFMSKVNEYQVVLTLSIDFYQKVNKVNKTMDEAIASYRDLPLPTHTSEAQMRLQQHEEEKRYITELYTTTTDKGTDVIAKIRKADPASPARREVEVTLTALEDHKDTWLNEWSRHKQKLIKAGEDTSLKLLKSELIVNLERAQNELDGMKKSRDSVSLTIEKFQDWEANIKVLEDQYQHYLSQANIALKTKPADKVGIQKDIAEVQRYWTGFVKNVDDYREKMELVINLSKQYQTLVSNLKRAERQLDDLQQPKVSETLTVEKFDDWQKHIKDLEKEYNNYVSTARIVLDKKPPTATMIERQLNEVQRYWTGFSKSVKDYREKMMLVANVRKQYKTLILNMERAEDDLKELERSPHTSSIVIEKYEDWEAHIKVLEDEYKNYMSTAHIVLDKRPPSSGVVEKDIAEAERYWSKLNRQVDDYRQKVEVAFNIHKRYKTLVVLLQKANKHLNELKTDYGEKQEDMPKVVQKFEKFEEQEVKPIEAQYKDFVSTASIALARNPPNAPAIKRDLDDVNRYWSKLTVSLDDQRKKLKTAPKFHDLYKTVIEWQNKGEDLLVAVGRKMPLCTAHEQAAEILQEVEEFIEKGDAKQKARLFRLNEMAIELYAHRVPPRVSSTIKENRNLIDRLEKTNDDLFQLANNLPKQKAPKDGTTEEAVVPQVQRAAYSMPKLKAAPPTPPPPIVNESVSPQYQQPVQSKPWEAPPEPEPVRERILPNVQAGIYKVPVGSFLDDSEWSSKTVKLAKPESPKPVEPEVTGYAPYFTRKIRDGTVKQGRATQLDCVIKGEPAPEVEWLKDDVVVIPSKDIRVECGDEGICVLSFYNTQPNSGGTYTCKAINDHGEAVCKAHLHVQPVTEEIVMPQQVAQISKGKIQLVTEAKIPKFIEIPGDKSVDEGKPLCLEVAVEGTPVPVVTWSKDGIRVKGEPYILKQHVNQYSLTIPEADLEDEGIFICTATNTAGKAECIIQVKVNEVEEPPVFVTPLQDANAKKGSRFAFECVLKGDPVPEVQWLMNNKPILEDSPDYNLKRNTETGVCRLEIDEVFPEDAAKYTCRATNNVGKAETAATLTVIEEASPTPPWIQPLKLESEHLEIPVGQPIKLAFKVSGTPEPNVSWLHDGRPVISSGRIEVTKEDTTHTLIIPKAEPEDSGTYSLKAENEKGQESTSIEIDVPRPPVVVPVKEEPAFSAPPPPKTPPGTAPRFKTRLRDMVVPDGQPFNLSCKVAGQPVPDITWYKDDKLLSEEPQYELSFMESVAKLDVQEAFLEDSGRYTCQATNPLGRDITSARVTVKTLPPAPPVIKPVALESTQLQVAVGKPVCLEFSIEAFPPPEVRWYHDGVPLKETEDMEIITEETNYKLKIKEAKPEYAGTYTVVAENEKGQESTSIEIDVVPPEEQMEFESIPDEEQAPAPLQSRFSDLDSLPVFGAAVPPKFQTRLQDQLVTEGEPIKLAIRVTGQPTPRVTWYKDDEPLAGNPIYEMSFMESVARLDVREAFLEDSGRYTCKATNPAGQDTTSAEITVNVNESLPPAPYIAPLQMASTHLDIPVGQPIKLHFRIRGHPAPKVTWMRNDIEVVETEEVEIVREERVHTLIIKNPTSDVSGKYSVVAENEQGRQSVTIVINVQGTQPFVEPLSGPVMIRPAQPILFSEHLSDKEVTESTEIKLRVKIEERPHAQVQWFFNNTPIQPSDRVEFLRDGDTYYLVIKGPTLADAGTYQCRAETEVSVVTTECTIVVNDKASPDFVTPLENVYTSEGGTVRFECRMTGAPMPDVKWMKDERQITETSRVRFFSEGDKRILQILQVRSSDVGNYKILLTNPFGKSVSSANLVLAGQDTSEDRPRIVIRLNDLNAKPGDRAEFTVTITGEPKPHVTWFKEGIEIQSHAYIEISQSGDQHTLVIPKVTAADSGVYSVTASSENGKDVSAATLHVDVPQAPTAAPHFTRTFGNRRCQEGESLTFECQITGDPRPVVSWFKDGVKVEQGVFQISEDGDRYWLEILEVFDEDAGVYECRAKNDFGEAICVATLRIKGELSSRWKKR